MDYNLDFDGAKKRLFLGNNIGVLLNDRPTVLLVHHLSRSLEHSSLNTSQSQVWRCVSRFLYLSISLYLLIYLSLHLSVSDRSSPLH